MAVTSVVHPPSQYSLNTTSQKQGPKKGKDEDTLKLSLVAAERISSLKRQYESMPSNDLKRGISNDESKLSVLKGKILAGTFDLQAYNKNLEAVRASHNHTTTQLAKTLSEEGKALLLELTRGIQNPPTAAAVASASAAAVGYRSTPMQSTLVSAPVSATMSATASPNVPSHTSRILRLAGHLFPPPPSAASAISTATCAGTAVDKNLDQKDNDEVAAALATMSPEQLLAFQEKEQIQANKILKERVLKTRIKDFLVNASVSKDRFILAIDGGGIRGIIPARVMAYIEDKVRKPIHQLFDLVAGTSTGAILALASACPYKKTGTPRAAVHYSSIYKDNAASIFNQPSLVKTALSAAASAAISFGLSKISRFHDRSWNTPLAIGMGGIVGMGSYWYGRPLLVEKYDRSGLDKVLVDYFGDETLGQLQTDVLIPTYSLGNREPWICDSSGDSSWVSNFINLYHKDRAVKDIAAATSAAPSYFAPYEMTITDRSVVKLLEGQRKLKFIDGGLAYNNPAFLAYVKAKNCWSSLDRIHLLSLGTGYWAKSPDFNIGLGPVKGGKALVGLAALETLFQCQSLSCHRYLNEFEARATGGDPQFVQYLRVDTQLSSGLPLDSLESVDELVKWGDEIAHSTDPFLTKLIDIKGKG